MALLTPMTLDEAKALGEHYGLAVTGLSPIPHGSVNSNFAVELEGGERRFLRVCEESDRAGVEQQNRLLAHLVGQGVPTPAPMVRVDGNGTVASHRGKPAVMFPFRPGEWLCQQRVTTERLTTIGGALATIHRAGSSYQDAPPSRFALAHIASRLDEVEEGDHSDEIAAAGAQLRIRVDELERRLGPPERPTVIHGDVFRDNVLWQGDRLSAILDFESASEGHASFDLMVTLLAWCFTDRFEQDLAQALMAGYVAKRELLESEVAACYDRARAAAVRFAVTRITDYELRPRDVVVFKDFRRFVARLEALEMIGERAFPAWLGLGD
jgi:homoserine kinase type II